MSAVGGIKIEIPRNVVVDIIMERLNQIGVPEQITRPPRMPAIGDAYEGGIYAGVTVHDEQPHALVLLPGDHDRAEWKTQMASAEAQDAMLPSRFDALVLFKNLKREFKEEAYWTSEQHASASGSAWYQDFISGYQHYSSTYSPLRARAVRRIPLSNLSI